MLIVTMPIRPYRKTGQDPAYEKVYDALEDEFLLAAAMRERIPGTARTLQR
jgi:hypothetical protein